jgi:N-acetylglucosaminyl-diphospho-decaprenol L-rhamnosyltransferase
MASSDALPTTPEVAVITVSFGSERVLPLFLDSLPHSTARALTVIVADNRPDDSTPVRTQAEAAGATYFPLPANLGYGGAINAAVRELDAGVEWLLISNPDVVLHEGAIDALLRRAHGDTTIGAVGPAIYTAEGALYPSARAVPSLRTGVGHALFANIWLNNPWSRAYRNGGNDVADGATVPRDAGWLSGACLLVRRSAFEQIRGFDSGYFMYFEDVDLGYRLTRAGFRNVYEPAAGVTHTGAHSTETDADAMLQAHHDSAKRFLSRKYSGPLLWPVRKALGLSLSVRAAMVRRKNDN